MSRLEVNTTKLAEIYTEWRGNESCYDNGKPVFEADELLDFAEYLLKHEANGITTGERQCNLPIVNSSAHANDYPCGKCTLPECYLDCKYF